MKPIILDRDGVINKDSKDFIKSPDEWLPIKGSLEAIARLNQAGYSVIVLTNQSGVGRGLFNTDMLGQIHIRMNEQITKAGGKLHSIAFCPHHPEDECDCRKPKTGLYKELGKRLGSSFTGVYSVGDSVRDLIAAKDAGATPVLVKTGNGKKTLKAIQKDPSLELDDVAVYSSLEHFVDEISLDQE